MQNFRAKDIISSLPYMKINKLSKEKEYVRTDEVKEIIDKAIVKAEAPCGDICGCPGRIL